MRKQFSGNTPLVISFMSVYHLPGVNI